MDDIFHAPAMSACGHTNVQRDTKRNTPKQNIVAILSFLNHSYFIKHCAGCLLIYGNCQEMQVGRRMPLTKIERYTYISSEQKINKKNNLNTILHFLKYSGLPEVDSLKVSPFCR